MLWLLFLLVMAMAFIQSIEHPIVDGIRVGRVDKKGNYHLTASCIVYRVGNTLIDTGPSREWSAVQQYLQGQSIDQVIMTHHHEDHSGNAHNIQSTLGVPIYTHPNNHQVMRAGLKMSPIRIMTFGSVKAFEPTALPASVETNNGYQLDIHHLPGHTDDLCCFHEPNQGWLFTGDLYVSSQIKYMTIDENVSDWITSLETALALDFETLFCSHRAVVNDGKAVLKKKLDFIKSQREEVGHWHQQGYSAKQIRRKMLGREGMASYLSLMHMSKANVINACLASLDS